MADESAIEDDSKWSSAAFRVFSETLQPGQIGAALGLEASQICLAGELMSSRSRRVRRQSVWSIESPLGYERNLAKHLNWLLDSLEPKLEVNRALSGKYGVHLFCGYSSANGQGGCTFDSVTLARLAKLGVPLVLDLYPPGPAEVHESGTEE